LVATLKSRKANFFIRGRQRRIYGAVKYYTEPSSAGPKYLAVCVNSRLQLSMRRTELLFFTSVQTTEILLAAHRQPRTHNRNQ
jgi:hypothetical protein